MKLLLATTNQGKIAEIKKSLIDVGVEIVTPAQIGLGDLDPEETGKDFQENALIKARAYGASSGLLTLAEDSGLVVNALEGRPGVYSKRYGVDDAHRNQKLLEEMVGVPEDKRKAYFATVACLFDPVSGKTKFAEGRVEGKIATEAAGEDGFGYDPVFIPLEGDGKTFAQNQKLKLQISHRARALQKIKGYLELGT